MVVKYVSRGKMKHAVPWFSVLSVHLNAMGQNFDESLSSCFRWKKCFSKEEKELYGNLVNDAPVWTMFEGLIIILGDRILCSGKFIENNQDNRKECTLPWLHQNLGAVVDILNFNPWERVFSDCSFGDADHRGDHWQGPLDMACWGIVKIMRIWKQKAEELWQRIFMEDRLSELWKTRVKKMIRYISVWHYPIESMDF